MGQAHAQDFERKRQPVVEEPGGSPYHGVGSSGGVGEQALDSSDEESEGDVEGEDEERSVGGDGEEGIGDVVEGEGARRRGDMAMETQTDVFDAGDIARRQR